MRSPRALLSLVSLPFGLMPAEPMDVCLRPFERFNIRGAIERGYESCTPEERLAYWREWAATQRAGARVPSARLA